ncbi:hypothetical protein [Priestia aryabhattai]
MKENENVVLLKSYMITNELFFEYVTGKVNSSAIEEDEFRSAQLKACLEELGELFKYSQNGINGGWKRNLYDKISSLLSIILNDKGYTKEYKEEEFINLTLPAISNLLGKDNKYTERYYRYLFNGIHWKENKTYTSEEKRELHSY